MVLSNGETWGYLNNDRDNETEGNHQTDSVVTLEPEEDEVIVGFYGQSDSRSGFTYQFGILTAPKGVELPDVIYDMPELSNA
ncbi:hypothetical protein BDW59DRAFT_154835 [Aspergillus cavernicola]|uniref:Jacalin-type lectin domain-containing protein n=1 Tax=Aspergillus cavernicola TaxID=176166 RepID=A0ABR4HFD0_9EURO